MAVYVADQNGVIHLNPPAPYILGGPNATLPFPGAQAVQQGHMFPSYEPSQYQVVPYTEPGEITGTAGWIEPYVHPIDQDPQDIVQWTGENQTSNFQGIGSSIMSWLGGSSSQSSNEPATAPRPPFNPHVIPGLGHDFVFDLLILLCSVFVIGLMFQTAVEPDPFAGDFNVQYRPLSQDYHVKELMITLFILVLMALTLNTGSRIKVLIMTTFYLVLHALILYWAQAMDFSISLVITFLWVKVSLSIMLHIYNKMYVQHLGLMTSSQFESYRALNFGLNGAFTFLFYILFIAFSFDLPRNNEDANLQSRSSQCQFDVLIGLIYVFIIVCMWAWLPDSMFVGYQAYTRYVLTLLTTLAFLLGFDGGSSQKSACGLEDIGFDNVPSDRRIVSVAVFGLGLFAVMVDQVFSRHTQKSPERIWGGTFFITAFTCIFWYRFVYTVIDRNGGGGGGDDDDDADKARKRLVFGLVPPGTCFLLFAISAILVGIDQIYCSVYGLGLTRRVLGFGLLITVSAILIRFLCQDPRDQDGNAPDKDPIVPLWAFSIPPLTMLLTWGFDWLSGQSEKSNLRDKLRERRAARMKAKTKMLKSKKSKGRSGRGVQDGATQGATTQGARTGGRSQTPVDDFGLGGGMQDGSMMPAGAAAIMRLFDLLPPAPPKPHTSSTSNTPSSMDEQKQAFGDQDFTSTESIGRNNNNNNNKSSKSGKSGKSKVKKMKVNPKNRPLTGLYLPSWLQTMGRNMEEFLDIQKRKERKERKKKEKSSKQKSKIVEEMNDTRDMIEVLKQNMKQKTGRISRPELVKGVTMIDRMERKLESIKKMKPGSNEQLASVISLRREVSRNFQTEYINVRSLLTFFTIVGTVFTLVQFAIQNDMEFALSFQDIADFVTYLTEIEWASPARLVSEKLMTKENAKNLAGFVADIGKTATKIGQEKMEKVGDTVTEGWQYATDRTLQALFGGEYGGVYVFSGSQGLQFISESDLMGMDDLQRTQYLTYAGRSQDFIDLYRLEASRRRREQITMEPAMIERIYRNFVLSGLGEATLLLSISFAHQIVMRRTNTLPGSVEGYTIPALGGNVEAAVETTVARSVQWLQSLQPLVGEALGLKLLSEMFWHPYIINMIEGISSTIAERMRGITPNGLLDLPEDPRDLEYMRELGIDIQDQTPYDPYGLGENEMTDDGYETDQVIEEDIDTFDLDQGEGYNK